MPLRATARLTGGTEGRARAVVAHRRAAATPHHVDDWVLDTGRRVDALSPSSHCVRAYPTNLSRDHVARAARMARAHHGAHCPGCFHSRRFHSGRFHSGRFHSRGFVWPSRATRGR